MLPLLPDRAVIQTPLENWTTVILPGHTHTLWPVTHLGGDNRRNRGLGVGAATWMGTQSRFDSYAGAKELEWGDRGRKMEWASPRLHMHTTVHSDALPAGNDNNKTWTSSVVPLQIVRHEAAAAICQRHGRQGQETLYWPINKVAPARSVCPLGWAQVQWISSLLDVVEWSCNL